MSCGGVLMIYMEFWVYPHTYIHTPAHPYTYTHTCTFVTEFSVSCHSKMKKNTQKKILCTIKRILNIMKSLQNNEKTPFKRGVYAKFDLKNLVLYNQISGITLLSLRWLRDYSIWSKKKKFKIAEKGRDFRAT